MPAASTVQMPAVDDEANLHDRLKSTLWYHVGKLVDDETIALGVNATPQFIGSLTELLWAQMGKQSRSSRSINASAFPPPCVIVVGGCNALTSFLTQASDVNARFYRSLMYW